MQRLLRLTVLLASAALAHELCRDPDTVISSSTVLDFCSAYSNEPTCCDQARDDETETLFDDTQVTGDGNTTACSQALKQILCSRCDAWEDHLYERNFLTGDSPTLCPEYCASVYQSCKNFTLTNSVFSSGSVALSSVFPSQTAFCNKFAPTPASYCFNGEPYVPPPPVTPSSDYLVCLEHLGGSDTDLLGVVPLPKRFDVLVEFTRGGIVRAINGSTGQLATAFGTNGILMTIQLFCPTPTSYSEQGLLSIAFRPDFATSGRLYAYGNIASSANNGIDTAIREFTCNDPVLLKGCIDTGLVMQVFQPFANHNGGFLSFAPYDDSVLILGTGDGGSGCDPQNFAQSNQQLLGKLLRIKLPNGASAAPFQYTVPLDNPFANVSASTSELCGQNVAGQRAKTTKICQEIWVVGLRNPFRCSIDRFDPDRNYYIYCGDVGQNVQEELDKIPSGINGDSAIAALMPLNYGWDIFEGQVSASASGGVCSSTSIECPPGPDSFVTEPTTSKRMECPITVETHDNGWASIIGGYFCRQCNEAAFQNRYVYADYIKKGLVVIDPANPTAKITVQTALCLSSQCIQPAGGAKLLESSNNYIWSFGEDNHGNFYLVHSSLGLYRVVSNAFCDDASATPLITQSPTSAAAAFDVNSLTTLTVFFVVLFNSANGAE